MNLQRPDRPGRWQKRVKTAVMIGFGCLTALLATTAAGGLAHGQGADTACVIVTGLGGVPEFEENFQKWGKETDRICREQMNAVSRLVDGSEVRKEAILQAMTEVSSSLNANGEMWLFLIGHGSHDSRGYKFNIAGPDLTDAEIQDLLSDHPGSRSVLIGATSASGALTSLAQPGRVIVTATRSERERQPPLFMSFFIEAAESEEADANRDGRVSIQEAFQYSEQQVKRWYEERGRIQTEHAVLSEAEGASFAASAYLARPAPRQYESAEAQSLARQRIDVEREIEDLKLRKTQLPEDEYFRQLETLLVRLATLNEKIESLEGGDSGS
ncbi:MAG TPA: hypothetical protein VKZ59_09420 [Acidobacteriota bacterium]|nr:hypothetical protein [Acidobacteriota bacterium]